MMLLAAILSAATRTKSGPCIPIKYSILYNSWELEQNVQYSETAHVYFPRLCADYTAKVCDRWRRMLSSPENALSYILCDAGGQFEWIAAAAAVVLRYYCVDCKVKPIEIDYFINRLV